ncbi:AraC family transcriptional regulator [Paenibacillus sp. FSL H8-0034]|uniref:AraC family transcriptional regulator n=1 Tax=Paenibacillus sp. FSL H8-0034 TaxID=2954671 RepID=UPI0030FC2958
MKTASFIRSFISGKANKGHLYRKSLLFVVFVACIPTAVIGISSYFVGSKNIEHEVNRTHQLQLKKEIQRIDESFSQLELSLTQWSQSPAFGSKLRNLDTVQQYADIQDLYKSILTLKASNPLIDKVTLYVEGPSLIITDEMTERLTEAKEKNDFASLLQTKASVFWTLPSMDLQLKQNGSSLVLVHTLSGQGIKPFGALLLYVNPRKLESLIKNASSEEKGTSFIVSGDYRSITPSPSDNRASQELQTTLSGQLASRNNNESTFIYDFQGEAYSISTGVSNRLGYPWIYVSATPMSNLTAPVVLISRLMIGISLIVLLLALLLSWFASNKLYKPIQRIVRLIQSDNVTTAADRDSGDEIELIEKKWQYVTRESQVLHERLDRALPALKEGFMLQLVQGHLQGLSENEVLDQMNQYGWDVEGKVFRMMLIQLHGLSNLDGRFVDGDEQLVTFAAGNIIEEIVGQRVDAAGFSVINFRDLTVGLLVFFPDTVSGESMKRDLYHLSNEMLQSLKQLLKVSVTISLSKAARSLVHISHTLNESRQALRYRSIEAEHAIIDTEELLPEGQGIVYPFDLENEILQTLRLGMLTETDGNIQMFLIELQKQAVKEGSVKQGMQQLLGSMLHVMLQTGFNPENIFPGVNLYEQFAKLREPKEMHQWFKDKVVTPYVTELVQVQDFYIKQLITKVADTIHREYMNDLSLEYFADLYGTSTVKLSSGFKQIMSVNFIDYLTKIRIGHIKELLVTTDMKINDIALACGYQPTYFNRIFKKHEGVTASEYRDTHKNAANASS